MAMNDDHVDSTTGGDDVASLADHGYDPAELERDEELLAALGAGERPGADGADADLLAMLADWRSEVGSAPLPDLPGDEEIAVALSPNVAPLRPRRGGVRSGRHHHGQRPALWQAATGAAAVAAMIVGGLSVAAHSAMPGDPLWGVSKTVFADRAGDVELVSDLSEHLTAADLAAREGDREKAERLLGEVSERLDEVGDASERVELMKRRDAIQRGLSRITPSAVPSPAPEEAPAPENSPDSDPATLVPGAPTPPPQDPLAPSSPGGPGAPAPLDGLQIPTSLHIPLDMQRLQDFLSPTTGQESPPQPDVSEDDMSVLRQQPSQSRTTVTQVPTPTQTKSRDNSAASTTPTS